MRFWHPFSDMAAVQASGELSIVRGEGYHIFDSDGRRYLDATASLWYSMIGHGRTEIADAVSAQMRELEAYSTFQDLASPVVDALAERMAALAPVPNSTVFFTSGGSDSIDTAVKMARHYWDLVGEPGRTVLIRREKAYHGMHTAGTSLAGIAPNAAGHGPLIEGIVEVPWDDADALFGAIQEAGADRVAAFFCEPVIGAGGIYAPPPGYLEKARQVCKDAGVLFIADEVITGFGRTGHWFATGGMKLKPDIVTLAKGITSAYFPVSASVISEKIWNVLKDASPEFGPVMHGFTYSGHPVGGALGLVNIDIMEREGLVENAAKVGPYLKTLLVERVGANPFVGDIRGEGMMLGVELVADKAARRFFDPKAGAHRVVAAKAYEMGVLTRALPYIEVTSFSPPLSMTRAEAEETVDRYGRALDAATADLALLARAS